MTSAVLLHTTLDDNLRQMGQSRELTNKIQKLRKETGISIDDQIEVFYSVKNPEGQIAGIINNHSDKIRSSIKMPFLSSDHMQKGQVVIGETSYEQDNEELPIFICKQTVHVHDDEVRKSFPANGNELNLESLRALLGSYDITALRSLVEANNGVFRVTLDNQELELKHKQHFFLGARERTN